MAIVLLADTTGWRVLASIVAGMKLASLSTLAHDAAHNALTSSRRLNKVLGVLGFTPGLFNYRLWVYDHHVLHHPKTNGPHTDSYKPLSLEQYRALPAWRQAWERFIRSPNPLAFGLYYIFQRWSHVKFIPTRGMPAKVRVEAWRYTGLIALYVLVLAGTLAFRASGDWLKFAVDMLLALGLPFFVFQTLMAGALYLNHTHPNIPWFSSEEERAANSHAAAVTVHVQLPRPAAALLHYFLEHPAHHVLPSIPCYRLWDAQMKLNELMGKHAVIVPASPRAMLDIMKRCKLYDYENHRWLDFNGNPTT
jgi:omega-6 fatty acid desaturase (delta-12 desaturase)